MSAEPNPTETDAADIWYSLDSEDRIVAVGGAHWASAGGNIVGTSVYDHVSGHFTRRFLRDFLSRARQQPGLMRQCYRCDSPDAKRLMEMRTETEHGNLLRVIHRMLQTCALPFPVHVREVRRAAARHLRCSSCNRLRRKGDDVWREPDDAAKPDETVRVVHTVCPDCRRGIDMRRQSQIFRVSDLSESPQPTH